MNCYLCIIFFVTWSKKFADSNLSASIGDFKKEKSIKTY